MKLYKFILILFILAGFVNLFIYLQKPNQQAVFSDTQLFINKLKNALYTSQLQPLNITIRDYNSQIEFYLQEKEQDKITKVILSTQKNPYWQIAVLQKIIKKAKMKKAFLKSINLSVNHPYATLKNY